MKKILITGSESYIGTSVENWFNQDIFRGRYQISTVDMRREEWINEDFSSYDVVFHVAGVAHQKETNENEHLYYEVNRDLSIKTAKKAKREGVRQFVLLSSMSVYGLSEGVITLNTKPNPSSHYGKSKLEADVAVKNLNDENFCVSILRPPLVYGKGCKGNYQLLRKCALNSPVFPLYQNQRSMVYIDNLAEYVRVIIDKQLPGIFFPQNKEYVSTCGMVRQIAKVHRRKILFIKAFNPMLSRSNALIVRKVFGNLIYIGGDVQKINMISFEESIRKTEEQEYKGEKYFKEK